MNPFGMDGWQKLALHENIEYIRSDRAMRESAPGEYGPWDLYRTIMAETGDILRAAQAVMDWQVARRNAKLDHAIPMELGKLIGGGE